MKKEHTEQAEHRNPITVHDFLLKKIQEGEEKFLKPVIANQEKLDQLRYDSNAMESFGGGYNINVGNNSHVNIHSADYSTNTVSKI